EGLRRSAVDGNRAAKTLDLHPAVYAEALQTILRRHGFKDPYEVLKELTRGRTVTRADLTAFIGGLDAGPEAKEEMLKVISRPYIGLAPELARSVGRPGKGKHAR
ncbi:MAG TPA: hypothetical protein PL037_07575, partial [Elusimicrobiales bacterium]|nr:hypothetical protein [Elusimicrobiales bacterium]